MTVHTGKPNSTPRVLQSRSGAIQGAQRFFVPKLYNTGKNAVENASGQCPGESRDPLPQEWTRASNPDHTQRCSGACFDPLDSLSPSRS